MTRKMFGPLATAAAVALAMGMALGGAQLAEASPLTTHRVTLVASAQQSASDQRHILNAIVQKARAAIPSIKSASPGVYSTIAIRASYPGSISYAYTYAQHLDPAAASAYFNGAVSGLKKVANSSIFPAMRLAGLKGTMHLTYVFKNPNGSTIWKKTFTYTKA